MPRLKRPDPLQPVLTRMPKQLYAQVVARALEDRRSINQQIITLIEHGLACPPPTVSTARDE